MIEYNTDGSVRFTSSYLHDSQNPLVYFAKRSPDGALFDRKDHVCFFRREDELFDEYARNSDLIIK